MKNMLKDFGLQMIELARNQVSQMLAEMSTPPKFLDATPKYEKYCSAEE